MKKKRLLWNKSSVRYKGSRKWHTKAQRSRQQKMKNGFAEIRKPIKKKTKTTTETKATKVVVVVLERRLDTNPTGLTHKCE